MPSQSGVRLQPGTYRLTTTNPATVVIYTVTNTDVLTTFGSLAWTEEHGGAGGGAYMGGSIALAFYDDNTFVALNGQTIPGTWLRVS